MLKLEEKKNVNTLFKRLQSDNVIFLKFIAMKYTSCSQNQNILKKCNCILD